MSGFHGILLLRDWAEAFGPPTAAGQGFLFK
jgi:hypothetical protein